MVFEGDLVDQGEGEEEAGEKKHLRRYIFFAILIGVIVILFPLMIPMEYATPEYYHITCIS